MSIKEKLVSFPQYILPHHLLSRLMGFLTHCENKTVKNLMIRQISKIYKIDTKEALSRNLKSYPSFNHFFTRQLKPELRPITKLGNGVASPADGVISQVGIITDDQIFQAKGKSFSAAALLGGDEERAALFNGGTFATIYLSPRDYHRLHMPLTGTLKEMLHIPGRLFSVNKATVNTIPGIFAKNERVVCIFDTEIGSMALVLVGAIFVSSIETVWDGVVTPPTASEIRHWQYAYNSSVLKKGDEMGRFNMGSTIIVLFPKDKVQWEQDLLEDRRVKMGELIGKISS